MKVADSCSRSATTLAALLCVEDSTFILHALQQSAFAFNFNNVPNGTGSDLVGWFVENLRLYEKYIVHKMRRLYQKLHKLMCEKLTLVKIYEIKET